MKFLDGSNVSVVIPVYNGENFIKYTIESLLNQTKAVEEIVIVNDKSTDKTNEILERYSSIQNIRVYQLEKNMGVSYARNYGASKSNGMWILFMDADDVAESELIEEYHKKLNQEKSKEWILIHTASQQIDENGNLLEGIHCFKQVESDEILGYQLLRNHVFLSGTLVKKEAFLKVGGFNASLKYAEDWDLWLRLANVGGFGYIDKPLFRIRRHLNNISSNVKDMLDGERKVLSQYNLDFIKKAIFRRRLLNSENEVDFANILFRLDHWEQGYKILEELLSENKSIMNKASFLKGIYFLQKKDYKSALNEFEEAIKFVEYDGASLNNLAVIYYILGNNEKSVIYIEKALRLFPGYLDAQCNHIKIKQNVKGEYKFTLRQLRPVLTHYKST